MQQQERRIEENPGKITSLLEKRQMQGDYPPESKMKKAFLKRAERLLAELGEGRPRMHTHNNFADSDKPMGRGDYLYAFSPSGKPGSALKR